MSFLSLSPLSLHLLVNRSHRSFSLHLHRSSTPPPFLRHKFTLPKRTVSSVLQTNDGVSSNSDLCSSEPDNFLNDVRIVAVVGEGALSPLKSASWLDVMSHTAERLKWIDEKYEMLVYTDNIPESNPDVQNLQKVLPTANILLIVSVTKQESVEWIQRYSQNIPNIICFDSSPSLENKLGGLFVTVGNKSGIVSKFNKKTKETMELAETISEAWIRNNSDDKNCGRQVLNCLLDPNCRKALQCLNQCSPVDQVCNYQCIASYESPILEEFSLCVLQKHNCLDLDAKIPEKPYVPPMVTFRDKILSHEMAEDLFVGWLGNLDWSWRVVAGQNPAYDQFPCQYQLFYRGKARDSFWYEPVFQYWTIVDVSEDFSWGLFHYSGAARVAGQSYTGAVLVSRNREYPKEIEKDRLFSALDRCCIKEWELFDVDNFSCKDPPLGLPEGSRLHMTVNPDDRK
ncbi:hypothetical protein L1987_55829 [Smallanthus sonchifolius]|uniref:Uncharacterized protein n=1 Tax=Smallanthus sonchifolius TaxID=185202 RepID=A0ACB9EB20_9ASTR|nr:hypothetical protein L1987_55829 [Smallanthus sonchifolius]